MLKSLRILVLMVISLASVSNVLGMECTAGAAIRSPISGDLVDCLEGGGDGCLICTETIVIRA